MSGLFVPLHYPSPKDKRGATYLANGLEVIYIFHVHANHMCDLVPSASSRFLCGLGAGERGKGKSLRPSQET